MQSWLKLTWVETKLSLREPGVYLGLALPVALILVFGSIYGNTPNAFTGGHGPLDVYVPAYIAMLIASYSFFSLPIAIVNYRERGVLFRLQATPLRPQAILAAQIGANFLLTAICALILIVMGRVFYNLHVTWSILNVTLAFVLASLTMFSFGFLLASVTPTVRVVSIAGMLLFFATLYLAGVLLPLAFLPATLREIVQFLPMTHMVALFQNLWLGGSWLDQWGNVLVLLGTLVVCVFVSAKLFRWR